MTTWGARLGVVAVFVVGFLGGGVTVSLLRARAVSRAFASPDAWSERVTRQLGRQLRLSSDQRERVRAILNEARAEQAVALEGARPRLVAVFDQTQTRIRDVLDTKQRTKFQEISARRRARFMQRFGAAGGAAAPPGPASLPVPSP